MLNDPVGLAALVNLKAHLAENVGGVFEAEMTLEIFVEMLRGGVFDVIIRDKLRRLRVHVHADVPGDAVIPAARYGIEKPLEQIAVFQRIHSVGTAAEVYLRRILREKLKLAFEVERGKIAERLVGKRFGCLLVDKRNVVEVAHRIYERHRARKLGIVNRENLRIALCSEKRA